MKRQIALYSMLALFILGLAVWGFLQLFEYKSTTKDTGYSAEAMRNPYLAAERFLAEFGIKTKDVTSMLQMKKLPPTSDILLITTGRYDLSSQKVDALLNWVRRGGHLIVRARQLQTGDRSGDDLLLRRLDVQTYKHKQKGFVHIAKFETVDVQVNDKIEDKKVSFDTQRWMKYTGKEDISWRVKGKYGSQVLEFHIGEGFISLLSDMQFMRNQDIAKHDNAAFLYTLVHMSNNDKKVWMVQHDNMPSLLEIILQKAPAAIVAFCVLLLIWLWYTTRRFGPLQNQVTNVRRSLSEHIAATGTYQWRNGNGSELFLSVKEALHEQLAKTRPLWVTLDDKSLADKLAKLAGLPVDRILAVLQAKTVEKENEFTQYIEVLSLIRKRL